MRPPARALWILLVAAPSCAPVDDDLGVAVDEINAPVLSNCSESTIRANAPPDADGMLDRAYNWIHRRVPYCQCVTSASSPFRADCSGFVSMVWRLSAPGLTTYSFAGGPWATGASVRLRSRNELRVGDALNYPGNPGAGTGHIVLFGGWLDRAHTRFCSLEESRTGQPAHVIVRTVDPVYIPIRLAGRRLGPLCDARCVGGDYIDGDCRRHNCGSGRCVDDSHGARCVDRGCPAWGTDAVCLDGRTVITCVNGDRRTTQRCTGANSRCLPEGNRVRCESPQCHRTGRHDMCLDSGEIVTCDNGRQGAARDCPRDTFCSEAGPGDARCVSRRCVANAGDTPVAHSACQTGGTILRCSANGAATVDRCPAGQSCSTVDGNRCVPVACPAGLRTAVCLNNERVVCDRGVVTERAPCDGTCVAPDGIAARCVSTACTARGADGRPVVQPARGFCLSETSLGFCDDTGHLSSRGCGPGTRCMASGGSAACVGPSTPPPPTDAGTSARDAGAAVADAGAAVTDAGEDPDAEELPEEDPDAGIIKDPDYDAFVPMPPEDGGDIDAGEGVVAESPAGGCAVGRASSGRGLAGVALLALLGRRRRRRR